MKSHRRRSRDDGAILMLMCISMFVLVIILALAIDLGFGRSSKRDSQSVVDLAALDAGYFLSGQGPNALPISEPRKGCVAAVESVQRNLGAFTHYSAFAIDTVCSSLPTTSTLCLADDPTDVVVTSATETLTIRYPVPDAEIEVDRFGVAGAEDGDDPCERMKVSLQSTNSTFFASMMGVQEMETNASSVVRGTTSAVAQTPPALLLLERTSCSVLQNAVSGAGNLGIIVEATASDPGLIHADSNGTTACSSTGKDAYVIYGSALSSGGTSITVGSVIGPPARPGMITTAATNGRGAAEYPGGLSTAPGVAGVISRFVVDDKYNSGSNAAITSLHATAAAEVMSSTAPEGYKVIGCGDPTGVGTAGASKLYVNCSSVPGGGVTFTGFTDVVFAGNVTVGNGLTMSFPDAQKVVVRGQLSTAGHIVLPAVRNFFVGDGIDLTNNASMAVNSTTPSSCSGREGPDWPVSTRMAIFSNTRTAFSSAANMALCQTTVYLAGPKTTSYAVQQTTTGGTCSQFKPCPKVTGNAATFAQFSLTQNSTIYWSAPNQHSTPVPLTMPQGLEDLALWTEGGGTSSFKSGAALLGTGVFFAPNSHYEMSSPASGSPRDAQFIARSSQFLQGTLRVRPQKNNSVVIPTPGAYSLIR